MSVTPGSLQGCILTPEGYVRGEVVWNAQGRIVDISGTNVTEEAVRSGQLPVVLPGFVDLHVHGAGGRDVMEGGDAITHIARMHARHGTTAMLATTMTAPWSDLNHAFEGLAVACRERAPGTARVMGVHLEGPYINEGKLGAQPDFARRADASELARLNELAPIKVITLAPEVSGHLALIEGLCAMGYRVQMGHTLGTYEEALEAMKRGASSYTHLFNAMTGLHHRSPGMVGAALAHAQYAEVIPDLLHVHPGAIRVALRAIPCLYCVTDSTAAAGMPDGTYRLGRHQVQKCLGGVRLADGTLAGSTLTMDQALRNLVFTLGLSLTEASARTSTHAAAYAGMNGRGQLRVGHHADMVALNPTNLELTQVVIEGEVIEHAHAD